MNQRKSWNKLAFSGLTAAALLIAGCSTVNNTASPSGSPAPTGENTSAATAKKRTDLVLAQSANASTLDPHDAQDNSSYSVTKTLYQGLLSFDKDSKLVPVLAEALPEVSKDAKSVTFKLKKGIKFQDGTDFNAEAVKINLERLKDPNIKLKRANLFAVVDHSEIIDPYTIKIVLNKPFAAILQTFAHPAASFISPKAIKEYGKELARKPVGTGPYQLVEWKDADKVVVKKYPDYWEKNHANQVEQITFKTITEAASRVAQLKAGDLQFVAPLPPEQVESVKTDANLSVDESQSIGIRYIAFNTTKKPFDDKRVRQALNYAINRDALIKVVAGGYGTKAESVVSPFVWGFQKQTGYAYDVDKAKKLLAEAGLAGGFETTIWASTSTESGKVAEFVQQQWKEIGVKANIQQLESAALQQQVYVKQEDSKLQTYSGGWFPSTGEADWGIRPVLTKPNFPPAGYNVGFYTNEQVEQNIVKGLESGDEKERLAAYGAAQKAIDEDAPWASLYVPKNISGKNKSLTGVYVLPDGILDVSRAEFK